MWVVVIVGSLLLVLYSSFTIASISLEASNTDIKVFIAKNNFTRTKLQRRASQCSFLGSSNNTSISKNNVNPIHHQNRNSHIQSTFPIWSRNTSLYLLGALKRDPGDDDGLQKIIQDLQILLKHWPGYTIIIYGDTGTRKYFRKLKDRCVYLVRESYSHTSRTHRLAYARNALWNQTRHMSSLRGEDPSRVFVLMMDIDGINAYGFHWDVLAQVMSETDQWDILSFYRKWYYDVWALRYWRYDVNCMYVQVNGTSIVPAIQDHIQRDVPASGLRYYPVLSAFAGIAFYKLSAGEGCTYIGHNPEDPPEWTEDCEHVSFHKCARERNGARVMMSSRPISPS